MAKKKAHAKAPAKRAAPKGKAKAAPKKAKAKAVKTAPRANAKAKAKPKPKAKPAKKHSAKPVVAAAPLVAEPVLADTAPALEVEPAAEAATEPKKGPLARFADGVGSLFARMTGSKPEPDEPVAGSPDQTMELASSDIMPETAPPPIPKPKS